MTNWLRKRPLFYTPPQKAEHTKPRHRLFRPWHIFITALKKTCMVIGAMVLFSAALTVWSASQVKEPVHSLSNSMVLVLRMDKSLPEKKGSGDYFSQLGLAPSNPTVMEVIDALDKARTDKRVKGFVLSLKSGGYELAQLQELRAAVLRFRESGKFTKVYAPSYGEAGSGLGMYYLASSFDEIWMQPVGVVSIMGLNAQMPFFKNILDKYGVKAEFFQRKEYKSAMENMTASQMSPASRQNLNDIIIDLGGQVVSDVARDRKKVSSNFRALVDQGLFTDDEALKNGLIDRLDYGDVLLSELRVKLDGSEDSTKTDFIDVIDYARAEPSAPWISKGKVAIVYVQGMILDGRIAGPYGIDQKIADAQTISQAIRDAASKKQVDTIVLRVNSPGGSPSASETIRRSIIWAKEKKNKKVIVSMGSTAASGAYWLSADADKIYVNNATLTGSIGVVGGKFDLSGLFDKFDVNWDGVSYGANSGMWSMNRGFSPQEQARFEASLDNVYSRFVSIVAKGRKLPPARAEAVARGRVWTGRQAVTVGLADEIGGMDKVLDDIAKEKKLAGRSQLSLIVLPEPENPIQALYDMVGAGAPLGTALPLLNELKAFMPFMQQGTLTYAPLPQL